MKTADGTGMPKLTPAELDRLRQESEKERASVFGYVRSRTYDAQEYAVFANYFLAWYRQSTGLIKNKVRSESARKRWAKRRKQHTDKTGARPNLAALKEILDPMKNPA